MGLELVESTFGRGELSAELALRDDVDHYRAGAFELTNVVSTPQGGVDARYKTSRKATLPGRTWPIAFEFNTSQAFIVALSALLLEVYDRTGAVVASIATEYTADDLFGEVPLDATQKGNTLIVTCGRLPQAKLFRNVGTSGDLPANPFKTTIGTGAIVVTSPSHNLVTGQFIAFPNVAAPVDGIAAAQFQAAHAITRVDVDTFGITLAGVATAGLAATGGAGLTYAATDFWSLTDIEFQQAPAFNFEDSLTPGLANAVQQWTFTGVWAAGDTYRARLDAPAERDSEVKSDETDKLTYSVKATENADSLQVAIQGLATTSAEGTIRIELNASAEDDPAGPYNIYFENEDGGLDWPNIIPKAINSEGGGLISVETTTQGGTGIEPSWSTSRGYPRLCALNAGRLYLGSSLFLPAAAWGSVVDEPFNFKKGSSLDDNGFDLHLGSGALDQLVRIIAANRIVLLSSNAAYALPDWPVTPRNALPRHQTEHGAAPVRAVLLEGGAVFVGAGRTAVWLLKWDDPAQQLTEEDLTILATHMIVSPQDMAIRQLKSGAEIAVTNAGDGTLAFLCYLSEHGVVAWTRGRTRTQDSFDFVAVIPDETGAPQLWATVRRTINGADVYTLEVFEASAQLDCETVQTSGVARTRWTGLHDYDGELVRVILDGINQEPVLVNKGIIDLQTAGLEIRVGFDALATVTLLPPVITTTGGRLALKEKTIVEARADFLTANNIEWGVINDEGDVEYSTIEEPEMDLDAGVTPLTGPQMENFVTTAIRPKLTIRQTAPGPFRLRGVSMTVEVSD